MNAKCVEVILKHTTFGTHLTIFLKNLTFGIDIFDTKSCSHWFRCGIYGQNIDTSIMMFQYSCLV